MLRDLLCRYFGGLALLLGVLFSLNGSLEAADAYVLNLNFGSGSKTGLVEIAGSQTVGKSTNDLWNLIGPSALSTTTNLFLATGSNSTISVTISNLSAGPYSNGHADTMLGSYIGYYPTYDYDLGQPIPSSVVVSNLPAATFAIYFYSFGAYPMYENETVTVQVGTNSYGPKSTSYGWPDNPQDPANDAMTEGWQYVVFTNVVVGAGQAVNFNLNSSAMGHAINGIQFVSYNTTPTLPSVSFSPSSGMGTPVTVSMSVPGHGDATIYYTTNGATPTTNSYVYSSALSFDVATTVKAFATKSGYNDSGVASATYPLSQLPIVSFSPTDGAGVPTNVVLSVSGHTNATIYYTTNGATPTTNSLIFSGAIALGTDGWSYSANRVPTMTSYTTPSGSLVTNSSVLAATSAYGWKAFDHSTATYWVADSTGPEWVSLELPSAKRVAKYSITATVNGDAPKNWTLEGWNGSSYVVVDTRSSETNWAGLERREFVCTNSAHYGKYRVNISSGNATSFNPSAYIMLGEVEFFEASLTIQAFATKVNWINSDVSYAEYHARPQDQLQVASPPEIMPPSGVYENDVTVSLACRLSGATLYWRTNQSEWMIYSNAFVVSQNVSVETFAAKSGFSSSFAKSNQYVFAVAKPFTIPGEGYYTNSVTLAFSNETAGASNYYSFDNGEFFSAAGGLTLTNTTHLYLLSTKPGYLQSSLALDYYFVTPENPAPKTLLNFNFGWGAKTGPAALGNSAADIWNLIAPGALTTNTGLVWANGSNSPVSLVVSNLAYSNELFHTDAMLNSYIYGPSYDEELGTLPAELQLRGLPPGVYDFVIFALLPSQDWETMGYSIETGTNSTSTIYNRTESDHDTLFGSLQDGLQFVSFRNVRVRTNETAVIKFHAGGYNHVVNGMQVMFRGELPLFLPAPISSPTNGTFTEPTTITLTNYWVGASNRYSFDGITWITNSSVTLEESRTLMVQSLHAAYGASPITTNSYTINLPSAVPPSVTPVGGEYSQAQVVTFYSAMGDTSFRYSLDTGATWLTNSLVVISNSATLLVQTLKYGYLPSASTTNAYVINSSLPVYAGALLNINFGSGAKLGMAAYGFSTNDAWNLVSATASKYSITNPIRTMVWADSNSASLTLVTSNLVVAAGNGHPDEMLGSFLYGSTGALEGVPQGANVKLRNLPSGSYDVYVYTMADRFYEHTACQLISGGITNGTKYANPDQIEISSEDPLTENLQYVIFTNVLVEAGTTLEFRLLDGGYNYALNGIQIKRLGDASAPIPSVNPPSGIFYAPTNMSLSSIISGATYLYSTNAGSSWQTYTSAISLNGTIAVLAKTTKSGLIDSPAVSNYYHFIVPDTIVTPNGGSYTNPVTVSMSNVLSGSQIEYSIDNGTNWAVYSGVFSLDGISHGTGVIKTRTSKTGYDTNYVQTDVDHFFSGVPVFSVNSGDYTNSVSLALTSSTTNGIIEYSVDGLNWATYTNALTFDYDTNVYARVRKTGYLTAGQVAFQASEGFDQLQGQNQWYYALSSVRGGVSNLAFVSFDMTNRVWRYPNTSGGSLIGTNYQQNSSTNDTIRVFVAPYGGLIVISNTVTMTNTSSGEMVRVLVNTNVLMNWSYVSNLTTPFALTTNVAAGDRLQFQLSSASNNATGVVFWDPFIQFVYKRTFTFDARDRDDDGLTEGLEKRLGLNITLADSDGNGIRDGDEDSDYDGVSNKQELLDGTDPGDPTSFLPRRLAYWKFNSISLTNQAGSWPSLTNGLAVVSTWSTNGVYVGTSNNSYLAYRETETNGLANINIRNGTVRFWVKPKWGSTNTGGTGPGNSTVLLSVGDESDAATGGWALKLNSAGTQLELAVRATTNTQVVLTNAVTWTSNYWKQIAITCSPSNTLLYINGDLVASNSAPSFLPSATARRAAGIVLGNDVSGTNSAKVVFEEMETFNYPLNATTVYDDYHTIADLDSDGDGLTDLEEDSYGTDPHDPDTDHDGLSDKEEFLRGTNPHAVDTDGDGLSDAHEVRIGTNPLSTDSNGNGISDYVEWGEEELLGFQVFTPLKWVN